MCFRDEGTCFKSKLHLLFNGWQRGAPRMIKSLHKEWD